LTRADVPRLADRMRAVGKSSFGNSSAWENTVSVIGLLVLVVAGESIRKSSSGVGLQLAGMTISFLVIGATSTAIRVRIRFRR